VLLATCDHFGHGMFAIVQRVLNQIHYARRFHLEPAVFLGETTFMEPQACELGPNPYHFAPAGDNVWEYWFLQPGHFRIGATHVRGLPVQSLQVVSVDAVAEDPIRTYGGTRESRLHGMQAAHRLLGPNGSALIRPEVLARAASLFAPWRARSSHIIGIHLRGTDKLVRPKVPPEAYFPLLDAYLSQHPSALIMLATDDRKYARRLEQRYPLGVRMVSRGMGYESAAWGGAADPVSLLRERESGMRVRQRAQGLVAKGWGRGTRGHGTRGHGIPLSASPQMWRQSGYQKGLEVLLDALLLSKCDYLLITASAVSEFALWISPHLWRRHLDLQATDRFQMQILPSWTRHVPGARNPSRRRQALAAAFCQALDEACANDSLIRGHNHRLYERRFCSRCKQQ